jgi:long-chain acyl-CoA synthetase
MKPAWLEHYSAGVPASIDVHVAASLAEVIDKACARFADRPAYSQGGTTLSYADFDANARHFAAWLQQVSGLKPGDRVALMMPNILAYPVALAGALRAGLVVVNVNPMYTARELLHQLTDSGATAIVAVEAALPLVRQIREAAGLRRVIAVAATDLQREQLPGAAALERGEDRFTQLLAEGADLPFNAPRIGRDELAFLQYTGGTTGVSKGAMLTHGNIVANLQQGAAWYGSALGEGSAVVITAIPLYHIFGMTFNCLVMIQAGALNRLVANPRDSVQLFAALAPGFTILSGVNTLFNGLLNAPEIEGVDFSTLSLTVSGGASTQATVAERWLRVTGCRIAEGYGLTETSPFALANAVHAGFGSGLLPMPSTEVAIRDDAGVELPAGEVGEICIRGPQVMRGYWRQPAETAAVLDADGWLRTGDVGQMDTRGAVTVTDRKKDMVLVSGFNVFPNEVEAVLVAHPKVVECAVIGVPDPTSGEALKAFVVARDAGLTAEALIEHCRASLTAYKVPRQFAFTDQLPKSPVGKILRRSLRA